MVTDACLVRKVVRELLACDSLAHVDRLEHRNIRSATAAKVVHGRAAWPIVEQLERTHDVCGVDVVPYLLAVVAKDRVPPPRHGCAHQVREEAVKLRARVCRSC